MLALPSSSGIKHSHESNTDSDTEEETPSHPKKTRKLSVEPEDHYCYLCNFYDSDYAITPCCQKGICHICYSGNKTRCTCGMTRAPKFACILCANAGVKNEAALTPHCLDKHIEQLPRQFEAYICNGCNKIHYSLIQMREQPDTEPESNEEGNSNNQSITTLCKSCYDLHDVTPLSDDLTVLNHYLDSHCLAECPFKDHREKPCQFTVRGSTETSVNLMKKHINDVHCFILKKPPKKLICPFCNTDLSQLPEQEHCQHVIRCSASESE